MARYGKEHKQATRRRIIETAGRRFKRDGIDGSGVATLMADAGLTNGAFYAHFDSKDDLVATAVADQLREQREQLQRAAAGPRRGRAVRARVPVGSSTATTPRTAARPPPCSTRSGAAPEATKRAYTDGLLAGIDPEVFEEGEPEPVPDTLLPRLVAAMTAASASSYVDDRRARRRAPPSW